MSLKIATSFVKSRLFVAENGFKFLRVWLFTYSGTVQIQGDWVERS